MGFPVAQRGSVFTVQKQAAFCTAVCTVGCSPYTWTTKLREKTVNHVSFSLLQGGVLQTELLVTSESSKGLQRAGMDSHFSPSIEHDGHLGRLIHIASERCTGPVSQAAGLLSQAARSLLQASIGKAHC